MFIRESYKKVNGKKKYRYLTIVESIRTPKGPTNRTVLNLGRVDLPKEKWPVLLEMLKRRLSGQRSILPEPEDLIPLAESAYERILRKGSLKAKESEEEEEIRTEASSIEVLEPRGLGPLNVAKAFWDRLGMGGVLKGCGMRKRDVELAMIEVFGRLIAPMSELATVDWLKNVAVEELLEIEADKINKDSLYRVTDRLLKHKEVIEERLCKKEERLFNLEEVIYLYDLTSTYFEGICKRNGIARYGYSRDGRSDCKQVVVGLVIDREGFVKRHDVFEGNRSDVKTLAEIVEKMKEKMADGRKATIIVDRGIASERNLRYLREKGYDYIVAVRGKERERLYREFEGIEKEEIEGSRGKGVEVRIKEIMGERYLLCKSDERGIKERAIRERFREGIEEELKRLSLRISSGRLKGREKIRERIGRIKQKYSRVARLYDIEVKEENGLFYLEWEYLEERESEKYDGIYLLRTNRRDLGKEEIWRLYMMLVRVEDAFRDLKGELGIRPVCHQKEERVRGHIFISILAYHLLHAIEWTLRKFGDKRKWRKIRSILETHQVVTVILPDRDGIHTHHIRVATEPNSEQKEIYKKLSVEAKPIKRKVIKIENTKL